MTLETLKNNWVSKYEPNEAKWNNMAKRFAKMADPTFEENFTLKILADRISSGDNLSVLDIGCGAGQYSIAMAKKFKHVTGIDLSSKMISEACKKAEQSQVDNVEFICGNWMQNIEENQYDVVFARNTPAINDYNSFDKMFKAGNKFGIYTSHSRRQDRLFDQLCQVFNVDNRLNKSPNNENISNIFTYLWHHGQKPHVHYHDEVWESLWEIDDLCQFFIDNVGEQLANNRREEVKDYLLSISKDGLHVEETLSTTMVCIDWQVI